MIEITELLDKEEERAGLHKLKNPFKKHEISNFFKMPIQGAII
jgi:hypothetical protein